MPALPVPDLEKTVERVSFYYIIEFNHFLLSLMKLYQLENLLFIIKFLRWAFLQRELLLVETPVILVNL